MFWKSIIAIPTLLGAFLATACSFDEAGNGDLLVAYRGHVAAAKSAVSDRSGSKTSDLKYQSSMTGHLQAMATTRQEMSAECSQIDGCPAGGGVAGHAMGGPMGNHMGGHMDNMQMLTAGEMTGMEQGEVRMGTELEQFRMHCLDESAAQETCDAYRQDHLERMAAMLEAHDAMCGRMMDESSQGGAGPMTANGGMATGSGGGMMGSGERMGSGGMMGTGAMMTDGGGTAMGSGGMAMGSGGMIVNDAGGMPVHSGRSPAPQ